MGAVANFLVLWTTSRCNLQCKYCYAYSTKNPTDMKFETVKRALDSFSNAPLKIQFTGGEPMLNFDLIREIVGYAGSVGYDSVFQMQTNGTLIDEKTALEIKNMRIRIGVSLDGPPDMNEILRGKTKQVLEGIQNLARAGVMVNLNSTVTASNIERMPALLDLALYLGNVGAIGLDIIRFAGRAKENPDVVSAPSPAQLIDVLHRLNEKSQYLYEATGKRIGIRPIAEAQRRLSLPSCDKTYCYASCGKSYVILPEGDVYPCGSLVGREEYFMGNINKEEIKRMWLPSSPENENCAACDYYDICPGGCPSRIVTNAEDFYDGGLDCTMRKTSFDIVGQKFINENRREKQ